MNIGIDIDDTISNTCEQTDIWKGFLLGEKLKIK